MFISKTFLPMFWVWKIIWIQAPKTWLGWHEMLKLDTECKWQLDANVGGIIQAIYKIPGKTWEGSITSDGVSGIWYLIVLSSWLEIHIAVLLKRKKEKRSHVTQDLVFSRCFVEYPHLSPYTWGILQMVCWFLETLKLIYWLAPESTLSSCKCLNNNNC